MFSKKIAIGCDHAGLELKERIKDLLINLNFEPIDFGTYNESSVDYPDFGKKVSLSVSSGEVQMGILICGTGIGMSIVANKFPGIRAALCHDIYTAKMSRFHNDSNILILGGRVLDKKTAEDIVRVWIETPFEGGRHSERIDKITLIEEELKL